MQAVIRTTDTSLRGLASPHIRAANDRAALCIMPRLHISKVYIESAKAFLSSNYSVSFFHSPCWVVSRESWLAWHSVDTYTSWLHRPKLWGVMLSVSNNMNWMIFLLVSGARLRVIGHALLAALMAVNANTIAK